MGHPVFVLGSMFWSESVLNLRDGVQRLLHVIANARYSQIFNISNGYRWCLSVGDPLYVGDIQDFLNVEKVRNFRIIQAFSFAVFVNNDSRIVALCYLFLF